MPSKYSYLLLLLIYPFSIVFLLILPINNEATRRNKRRRKIKRFCAVLQIFYQPEHFYHKPQPVIKFFQTHSFFFALCLQHETKYPWIHFTLSRFTIFCVLYFLKRKEMKKIKQLHCPFISYSYSQLASQSIDQKHFAHWKIHFFFFFFLFYWVHGFFSLSRVFYYFMSYNRSINQSNDWNRTILTNKF